VFIFSPGVPDEIYTHGLPESGLLGVGVAAYLLGVDPNMSKGGARQKEHKNVSLNFFSLCGKPFNR
jgi:hypothetical protein